MSLPYLEVLSALGQPGLTLASSCAAVFAFSISAAAAGISAFDSCISKNELMEVVLSFYFYLLFSDRQSCINASWDSWLMMMEFKFEVNSLFILYQTLYI